MGRSGQALADEDETVQIGKLLIGHTLLGNKGSQFGCRVTTLILDNMLIVTIEQEEDSHCQEVFDHSAAVAWVGVIAPCLHFNDGHEAFRPSSRYIVIV